MSFFHALGRILGGRLKLDEQQQQQLISAWKLDDGPRDAEGLTGGTPKAPARPAAKNRDAAATDRDAAEATAPYDQAQWHRKLKSILEKLPASQPRWADLAAEVRALKLDPDWVRRTYREEFTFLVRRAVADAVVTPEEHQRIDLARRLVGLSEAEAEAILHAVVAEVEAFFGKPIAGA